MNWPERHQLATRHEQEVLVWLREWGWDAYPFGQALFSESARDHLRLQRTNVRWLPDIIAFKDDVAIYVDAKASDASRYGNHAVETASSEALSAWQEFSQTPVYYAFPHEIGNVLVPLQLWVAKKRPGVHRNEGSGTPFDIAPCKQVCQESDAGDLA